MSSLIGKQAPDFSAPCVKNGSIDTFSLASCKGKNVLLFFYPLDFTFVCPTEIVSFQKDLEQFEARNTIVVGCSVDSQFSHLAWVNTPKNKGGIAGVTFPLVSDINKTIAKAYGVLKEDAGIAFRGTFLINKEGVVCFSSVQDLFLGRTTSEYVQLIDALSHYETNGTSCPANWKKGNKGLESNLESVADFLTS